MIITLNNSIIQKTNTCDGCDESILIQNIRTISRYEGEIFCSNCAPICANCNHIVWFEDTLCCEGGCGLIYCEDCSGDYLDDDCHCVRCG